MPPEPIGSSIRKNHQQARPALHHRPHVAQHLCDGRRTLGRLTGGQTGSRGRTRSRPCTGRPGPRLTPPSVDMLGQIEADPAATPMPAKLPAWAQPLARPCRSGSKCARKAVGGHAAQRRCDAGDHRKDREQEHGRGWACRSGSWRGWSGPRRPRRSGTRAWATGWCPPAAPTAPSRSAQDAEADEPPTAATDRPWAGSRLARVTVI